MKIPKKETLRSGTTSQGNFIVRLPTPRKLNGNAIVRMNSLCIPHIIPNISSAKGNNKYRYVYNSTNYDITINDGIYDADKLRNVIYQEQYDRSHYDTDESTGVSTFYFDLDFDQATGSAWIKINKATTEVQFPESTFYKVIGFTSTDYITNGVTSTGYNYATEMANISQGTSHFRLELDCVYSNYGSEGNSSVLYSGYLDTPHAYNRYPKAGERDVIGYVTQRVINSIRVKILDDSGNIMTFLTANDDDIEEIVQAEIEFIDNLED